MIKKEFSHAGEGFLFAIDVIQSEVTFKSDLNLKSYGITSLMKTHGTTSPIKRSVCKNRRNLKRELSFTKSTHLILRLKETLPGLFEPRDKELRNQFYRLASKYQIKIYRLVFNHTHIHAVVLLPERKAYVRFIRELTSTITRHLTESLDIPGLIFRKIFLSRPFTRIVPWGRAFRGILNYIYKNEVESGEEQAQFNAESERRYQLPYRVQCGGRTRRDGKMLPADMQLSNGRFLLAYEQLCF